MISMFKHKVAIQLRSGVAAKIHSIAQNAMPQETGGLLLGWWDGYNVVIEDAAEVVDINATINSWIRHEHEAQEALNVILKESSASPMGYVGDWHSHPAMCGASATDLASLLQASTQYHQPLVLAVRLPNDTLEFHAARNGKLCVQLIINYREKIMSPAPHAAAVRGDDYQFTIGWYWACHALTNPLIESISLEDSGAGHFDDLVVRRQGGRASYKQIKSSNAADVVITEKWLTTAVTASGKSPIQHFYNSWKTLQNNGSASDFAIVTNRGLDHTDPILKLRDNISTLVTTDSFTNATTRSEIGKAKQRWAQHLGVTDGKLFDFLNNLKLETEGSERSWDRQACDAMRGAGLRTDDDALARGKEMVKNWVKTGAGPQTVDDIRRQVADAGLLATTGTLVLAIDAIDHPSRSVVPNLTLDWVDLYNGTTGFNRRQLHDPENWGKIILPEIQSAVRKLEGYGLRRVHLTAAMRLPLWFAFGAHLPRTRGWVLSCDQNGNEWRTDAMPIAFTPKSTEKVLNLGLDIAITIALSQDSTEEVAEYIATNTIPIKKIVTIGASDGPSLHSVSDGAHALSWAASARDIIIKHVRTASVRKIHLFMAAPAGAILMLGYYWNMLPPTQVYEHLGNTYAPTFVIQ